MTPRESATVHLPDLVESWSALKAAFGAAYVEHLITPDNEWGSDPTAGLSRLVGPGPLPVWNPPKSRRRA